MLPLNYGPCPRFPLETLSEDGDYRVHTDRWGIVRRDYKHGESMCEFLEFPVKNRDDWERYKSEHLDPCHPDRLAGDWREQAAEWTVGMKTAWRPVRGLWCRSRVIASPSSGQTR